MSGGNAGGPAGAQGPLTEDECRRRCKERYNDALVEIDQLRQVPRLTEEQSKRLELLECTVWLMKVLAGLQRIQLWNSHPKGDLSNIMQMFANEYLDGAMRTWGKLKLFEPELAHKLLTRRNDTSAALLQLVFNPQAVADPVEGEGRAPKRSKRETKGKPPAQLKLNGGRGKMTQGAKEWSTEHQRGKGTRAQQSEKPQEVQRYYEHRFGVELQDMSPRELRRAPVLTGKEDEQVGEYANLDWQVAFEHVLTHNSQVLVQHPDDPTKSMPLVGDASMKKGAHDNNGNLCSLDVWGFFALIEHILTKHPELVSELKLDSDDESDDEPGSKPKRSARFRTKKPDPVEKEIEALVLQFYDELDNCTICCGDGRKATWKCMTCERMHCVICKTNHAPKHEQIEIYSLEDFEAKARTQICPPAVKAVDIDEQKSPAPTGFFGSSIAVPAIPTSPASAAANGGAGAADGPNHGSPDCQVVVPKPGAQQRRVEWRLMFLPKTSEDCAKVWNNDLLKSVGDGNCSWGSVLILALYHDLYPLFTDDAKAYWSKHNLPTSYAFLKNLDGVGEMSNVQERFQKCVNEWCDANLEIINQLLVTINGTEGFDDVMRNNMKTPHKYQTDRAIEIMLIVLMMMINCQRQLTLQLVRPVQDERNGEMRMGLALSDIRTSIMTEGSEPEIRFFVLQGQSGNMNMTLERWDPRSRKWTRVEYELPDCDHFEPLAINHASYVDFQYPPRVITRREKKMLDGGTVGGPDPLLRLVGTEAQCAYWQNFFGEVQNNGPWEMPLRLPLPLASPASLPVAAGGGAGGAAGGYQVSARAQGKEPANPQLELEMDMDPNDMDAGGDPDLDAGIDSNNMDARGDEASGAKASNREKKNNNRKNLDDADDDYDVVEVSRHDVMLTRPGATRALSREVRPPERLANDPRFRGPQTTADKLALRHDEELHILESEYHEDKKKAAKTWVEAAMCHKPAKTQPGKQTKGLWTPGGLVEIDGVVHAQQDGFYGNARKLSQKTAEKMAEKQKAFVQEAEEIGSAIKVKIEKGEKEAREGLQATHTKTQAEEKAREALMPGRSAAVKFARLVSGKQDESSQSSNSQAAAAATRLVAMLHQSPQSSPLGQRRLAREFQSPEDADATVPGRVVRVRRIQGEPEGVEVLDKAKKPKM